MNIDDFVKISPYRWSLPKGAYKFKGKMNADVEIFGTENIIKAAIDDKSVEQVVNVSTLPGIVSHSFAMPDIHYGYGFSIGGVAAFHADSGIVSPGGVGYDINCGVRLLATNIPAEELDKHKYKEALGYAMLSRIPTGMGDKGSIKPNKKEFLRLLQNGAEEIVKHYSSGGEENELRFIESSGKLDFNMPEILSDRAIERGYTQVGSLGGGNHFLEVQRVEEIYDEKAAAVFGLRKGYLSILIHTGSRGFGHQVATDFIERIRKKNLSKIDIIDSQLVYAAIDSPEGQHYLQALNAASNFAWANRSLLMYDVTRIFEDIFKSSAQKLGIRLVYDQAHNIAKFETHSIEGKKQKLLVHRKGATRAFPPGHPDIPREYRPIGQPVLIPGSMGTSSFVLRGTEKAMEISLGSSAHGAGRHFSRHQAIKFSAGANVHEQLKQKNILVFSHSQKGLREEIPEAYKEIDEIIEVTVGAGISEKVAKMIPLIVIKG
jgi:tRNA-splicing ligase RtcB (3'-phosphate/5'-hydroxy nucleic acid ligase)